MKNNEISIYKIFRNTLGIEPLKNQIDLLERIIRDLDSQEKRLFVFSPEGTGKISMSFVLAEYLLQRGAKNILILTNTIKKQEIIKQLVLNFTKKKATLNDINTHILNVHSFLAKIDRERYTNMSELIEGYDYIITEDLENYDVTLYRCIIDKLGSKLICFSSVKGSSYYEGTIPVIKFKEMTNYNAHEIKMASENEIQSIEGQLYYYKKLFEKELREKEVYKRKYEESLLHSELEKQRINEEHRREIEQKDFQLNFYKKEAEDYKSQKSMLERILDSINLLDNKIENGVERLSSEIKVLDERLRNILNILDKLQNETMKEITLIRNEEEKEKVYHNFSTDLMEKIITSIESQKDAKYNDEKEKLISIFSLENWNKLSPESKEYLITSRIVYNNMRPYEHQVDFSPVCIPMTKALEQELFINIFKKFKKYCNIKSIEFSHRPDGITFYDRNAGRYSDLRNENFSLGSISYIIGSKIDRSRPRTGINKRGVFIQYCKESLFKNTAFANDQELTRYISKFEVDINDITNKYRNQAAHKDQIKIEEAKECYNYIIAVTKVLVNFMDKLA